MCIDKYEMSDRQARVLARKRFINDITIVVVRALSMLAFINMQGLNLFPTGYLCSRSLVVQVTKSKASLSP